MPLHTITTSAGMINRLKPIRAEMEKDAKRQTTTVTQLAGLIIAHERYHPKKDEQGNVVEPADRETAKVGMAIFRGEPVCKVHKATIREGVYATDRLRLTSTGYRGLRKLTKTRFVWPPLNTVADFKKEMMRPKMYPDYKDGARAVLAEALANTIQEHLQVALEEDPTLQLSGRVIFNFSYGYDGSGQHPVFSMEVDTSSKVLGNFTISFIRDAETGRMLFDATERGHNSVVNSRPYMLVPRQEGRDMNKDLLQGSDGAPGLEDEIKKIMQTPLSFVLPAPDNTPIEAILEAQPVPKQQDDKTKKTNLGIGGAYCTICTVDAATGKSYDAIAAGFPMDRSLEEMNRIAARLVDPETGEVPQRAKRTGDYSGGEVPRQGITWEAITEVEETIKVLPIMHAKIHAVDWLSDLLRRIISDVELWYNPLIQGQRHYTPEENVDLAEAKSIVKEHMMTKLGISVFDGKSMTTGNKFNVAATDRGREKMASLIDYDDDKRQAFLDIHLMLCAVVRVGNSQRSLIDVEVYKEVATECYLKIVEAFPWAQVPESIHQVLAHVADLVEDNGGYGLGNGCDGACERVIKEMRYWEVRGSRTDSPEHNLLDTFNHMWQYSSPLLHPIDKRMKERNRAKKVVPGSNEEIESLVRMMFISGDIPPSAAADAE